jgi:signal transduction histidine kinase
VSGRSLRWRLLGAAALSIAAAVAVAGVLITLIFQQHVERRVYHELEMHLRQIAAGIESDATGQLVLQTPSPEPRFAQPLSGLYWQLVVDGIVVDRSRSLWDQTLALPTMELSPGGEKWHRMTGPDDAPLQVLERVLSLESGGKVHALRIFVGINREVIIQEVLEFAQLLALSLGLLGATLLVAAWWQVKVGLRPLAFLQRQLAQVRSGEQQRLPESQPQEVLPLVRELNGLLVAQEAAIARARARAGDLAHGLKTPLTILNGVGRKLEAGGHADLARELAEQTASMDRHVQRELARVRIAAKPGTAVVPLGPSVDRLIKTMRRLPDGDRLRWETRIGDAANVAIDAVDLEELLGNLLDNARKWAQSRVTVSAIKASPLEIRIEDDGPGVPEDQMLAVQERGGRLDPVRSGSGLGLTIARDIAEAYGLSFTLFRSPIGGLGIRIVVPDAASPEAG